MPSRTSRHRSVLWIATRNRGKSREFQNMLGKGWKVCDLHALPQMREIRETGRSFLDNAKIKALAVARSIPDRLILADDSGLVVPALVESRGFARQGLPAPMPLMSPTGESF